MSLFKDKDLKAEMEAKISEHEATIVSLTEDMTATQKQNDDLNDKLESIDADHKTAIIDLTEKLEASEANVETITAELEESKGKQEDFDSKVEAAAAAKVAAIGHPEPVTVEDDDVKLSLYEQYKELKATNPAKAGAFWRENEAAIKASV